MADAKDAKKANSNLAVRLATAAVGAPLIIALLYKGPPWGFYLLVLGATLIGAWELFNMTHPGDRLSQVLGAAMTAIASLATYVAEDGSSPDRRWHAAGCCRRWSPATPGRVSLRRPWPSSSMKALLHAVEPQR